MQIYSSKGRPKKTIIFKTEGATRLLSMKNIFILNLVADFYSEDSLHGGSENLVQSSGFSWEAKGLLLLRTWLEGVPRKGDKKERKAGKRENFTILLACFLLFFF